MRICGWLLMMAASVGFLAGCSGDNSGFDGSDTGSISNDTGTPNVNIWCDRNPCEAGNDRWAYTLSISNDGSDPVTVDDIAMDYYDATGTWYSTQWLDPNAGAGMTFPYDYCPTNMLLYAGDEQDFSLEFNEGSDYPPIDTWSSDFQTGTNVFTVDFTMDGQSYYETYAETFTYGGVLPVSPSLDCGVIKRTSGRLARMHPATPSRNIGHNRSTCAGKPMVKRHNNNGRSAGISQIVSLVER